MWTSNSKWQINNSGTDKTNIFFYLFELLFSPNVIDSDWVDWWRLQSEPSPVKASQNNSSANLKHRRHKTLHLHVTTALKSSLNCFFIFYYQTSDYCLDSSCSFHQKTVKHTHLSILKCQQSKQKHFQFTVTQRKAQSSCLRTWIFYQMINFLHCSCTPYHTSVTRWRRHQRESSSRIATVWLA